MSAATPAPLAGGAKAITALALALGTFMQVLDTTIANVSIPTIAGDLGVSADQGTWIITSFAVANGVSVPLTGWLMQRFGVVKVFVLSVLLFTAASFLCGAAWSLPSLIAFRVLQGAVSGPMIPGSQALLISIFGPQKRGMALAIWSMTTLLAPIAGPILGGYISDNYIWPWIFFINIPIGLFCSAICWRALKSQETPTRKLPIDSVGLGLLIVWVGALQILLDKGKDLDWFASTPVVVLALVAAIAFAAWLIWELTEEYPIVDLSLFKSRGFAFGAVAMCLGYAVFFGNIVIMPIWMQAYLDYTATWAGLVAAPAGLVAVVVSPLVGQLMSRYDARWFASASFVFYAISYFMRADYTADSSFVVFVLPMLVQGIAVSMFFVGLLSIVLDGLPAHKIPAASGLVNFLRITAAGFATSLITTYWDRREAFHQSRLSESVTAFAPAYRQSLTQLHALGFDDPAAAAMLTRGMISQGYLMSSVDMFYISGWLSLAMIPLCWMVRKPAGAAVAGGD